MIQHFSQVLSWIPSLLEGTKITVLLTLSSVSVGLLISVLLAVGKISSNKISNLFCSFYIFFFRGTPLLLQLYFIYYGLPKINECFMISNRFLAAFIAFSLNCAAYLAEVIRSAILSIDKGQIEAARSLGLSNIQVIIHIILPQAFSRILPPLSNEFILVLKDASLVSIIALSDLTRVTQNIASSSSSALVFIPAMIIYLIITAFFSFTFKMLEEKAKKL